MKMSCKLLAGSGKYRLIARRDGSNKIDFNTTSDQLINVDSGLWILDRMLVVDATASLPLARGALYKAAGRVSALTRVNTFTLGTGSEKFEDLSPNSAGVTDVIRQNYCYFTLTTTKGSPAYASIYIWAFCLD